MADIAIVGAPFADGADNGGDVTLTLPSGMQLRDVVLVFGGHTHRAGSPLGPSTLGYTECVTPHTAAAPNFGAWCKVMGSSPDADVVLFGSGNAVDSCVYAGWVFRGVDPSVIFDATATVSGPTTGTNPDSPEIVTVTAGAWVLTVAGSVVGDTEPGTPTDYENLAFDFQTDGTSFTAAGATRLLVAAGAEDPGAFPTWSSGDWYAITLALRPSLGGSGGAASGLLTIGAGS